MEGIRFSDTKKITNERTVTYLSKFRQIWNEHKAKWPYNYKIKYNKYIEGYSYLSQIFINDVNKSITNDSLSISNDKQSMIEGQTSKISLFNQEDSRLYTESPFLEKSGYSNLETKKNNNKTIPDVDLFSNGNDRVELFGDKYQFKRPIPAQPNMPNQKSCCQCFIF